MVLRRRVSRTRALLLEDFKTENPVLESCLIFETSNSLEAQQPVPETNKSSHLEDSQLIARARAVCVIYEFAEPGLVKTEDDRRKRHRRNQRRITNEEKRLREVVGDLPPPPLCMYIF